VWLTVVDVSHPPVRHHRRRRPSGEAPPLPRQLNRAAHLWLAAFLFWGILWVWVFVSDRPAIVITEWDLAAMAPVVDNRPSWLTPTMRHVNSFGTHWLVPLIGWTTLILGLWFRRVRHVLILIAALSLTATTVNLVAIWIERPRPLGVDIIGDWEGFAQPSRPVALLAAVGVAATLTLVPGRFRRTAHVTTAAVVAGFGFAQVYTGVDHPTDVFAAASVGVAFTLVLYRAIAPEPVFPISYSGRNPAHLDVEGPRGEAIRVGVRQQLGIEVGSIELIGLEGSAGSTPVRVTSVEGQQYFAKLYASSHLRSDRSYKLWRTLVYGRLEDEQHFNSVRRLVQHEDYMLHVMARAGIPSPEPVGLVEITPDREYLLVMEFVSDGVEIGDDVEVDEELIDDALRIVDRMWRSGLAHRDIKPANLMVQDQRLRVVDVAFAQVRPSPWRQAVDLANMMLVLGLWSSPELVHERATERFSDDELAEAFAASRGVTLPSQLRRSLRRDGRELLDRFRDLVPQRRPVAIQRWSIRRVGLTAWVVLVAFAVASIFLASLQGVGLR